MRFSANLETIIDGSYSVIWKIIYITGFSFITYYLSKTKNFAIIKIEYLFGGRVNYVKMFLSGQDGKLGIRYRF